MGTRDGRSRALRPPWRFETGATIRSNAPDEAKAALAELPATRVGA